MEDGVQSVRSLGTQRALAALSRDRDDEWHSIDSTINRVDQHASGGKGGLQSMASVVRVAA
jgi:hypothetical protein